ncbi:MAG: hypothetical protein Kow0080_32280 [Candidatus Promineifilaceae bacterium]
MSEEKVRCGATTKSGKPCKNWALAGSAYCRVHAEWADEAAGDTAVSGNDPRLQELMDELDSLVNELKASIPADSRSPYSPLRMATMLRENISQLAPDLQLSILENFQGMTKEDLMDLDTWKGMAYMAGYSARFQAGQVKDKMNETLPKPFKPDTWLGLMKQGFDKFAPDFAKEIAASFEGATAEDFMDPDTWKGVFYMLNYSLQFQAQQWKERLTGSAEDEAE